MSPILKYTGLLAVATGIATGTVIAGDGATAKTETASVSVATLEVGQKAPNFLLKDTEGKTHTLKQYLDSGKTVVVQWFNGNCPFIVRHFEKYTTFTDLDKAYAKKGVALLAVNSTNPNHPQFGGDVDRKKGWKISYPILLDPDGAVGKLYAAKTTPHVFIVTPDGVLQYAGAIDDDPQDTKKPNEKVNYVRQALDEVLSGKPVTMSETRPYGCGVKYAQ